MNPLIIPKIVLCSCGAGTLEDGEGECRQCREDIYRRKWRDDSRDKSDKPEGYQRVPVGFLFVNDRKCKKKNSSTPANGHRQNGAASARASSPS